MVLDAFTDRIAVDEAAKAKIAVVALADANADPDGIDYVVPGNDDAVKSVKFILENMLKALS